MIGVRVRVNGVEERDQDCRLIAAVLLRRQRQIKVVQQVEQSFFGVLRLMSRQELVALNGRSQKVVDGMPIGFLEAEKMAESTKNNQFAAVELELTGKLAMIIPAMFIQ